MTLKPMRLLLALACCSTLSPASAQDAAQGLQPDQAQVAHDDLMALDRRQLRREIAARFDRAVAASRDPGIIAADNARFLWATEAKVQCGIALGYLRSGHKDPISVPRCAAFAEAMDRQDAPAGSLPAAATGGF